MDDPFRGRRALVTGASSGIGTAFARAIAEAGGDLVLVARRETQLKELAEELRAQHGVNVAVLAHDLALPGAAAALASTLEAQGLVIEVLVNNAGLGLHGDLAASDVAVASQQLAVNVTALTELTALLVRPMVERGEGLVVNIASTAAFQPVPHMAVYAATKAYVLSFSRALWAELRPHGVRVLAVCPGATETEFFTIAGEQASVGTRRRPASVVATTIRALRTGRPAVVDGATNALVARTASRLPSRLAIALAERSVRPQH